MGYVEHDPALGALNGKWLVGDQEGLKVVSSGGEVSPLPGVKGKISCLAVRPLKASPSNPHHVAFATFGSRLAENTLGPGIIRVLNPDGSTRVLAGKDEVVWGPGRVEEGHGPDVHFGMLRSMVMAPDGSLFVTEAVVPNRVRKIAPTGEVTNVMDTALEIKWLTLNPETGDLFGVYHNQIVQITQTGAVSSVLGVADEVGFEPVPKGHPVPKGVACLANPIQIQCQGQRLFIADRGNGAFRMFNLETRVLHTLTGHASKRDPGMTPMGHFSPPLPAATAEALGGPMFFTLNADSDCLMGCQQGVIRMNLSYLSPQEP